MFVVDSLYDTEKHWSWYNLRLLVGKIRLCHANNHISISRFILVSNFFGQYQKIDRLYYSIDESYIRNNYGHL